ncbi:MAG: ABC transporter ATP-binding protein [Sphingomonadaceae bacterium]
MRAGRFAQQIHVPGGAPERALAGDSAKGFAAILRIIRLAADKRLGLALAIGCAIGSALANIALPNLYGRAIDEVQELVATGGEGAVRILALTGALAVLAALLRGSLSMGASYMAERVSQSVASDLRLAFFDHLQRLSFTFHDRMHSGDLISRGMSDLEAARAYVQGGLLPLFSLVLLLAFTTVMMVSANPFLALVGLAFVPPSIGAMVWMSRQTRISALRQQGYMSDLSLAMEDSLQGTRVVRAFWAGDFELGKFDIAADKLLDEGQQGVMHRTRGISRMMTFYYASMGLVLWLGGQRVLAGSMTIGGLTAFIAYMMMLQGQIRQIGMIFGHTARAMSSGERLFEVLDRESDIKDAPSAVQAPSPAVLRFEDVSFQYPGTSAPALAGISFELQPGEILGVIGAPGSGKSTILQLIPRFYDVTSGRITLGGVDLRDIRLTSLRGSVSLVPQDAFLFDGSIGDNLAYADPWSDEQRLVEAATIAQIQDHIETLPEHYETRVGERGVSLSGGQRQRLSIGRGLVPDPQFLLLDDSTAAIDMNTEARLREALKEATRGKTIIIAAHRVASLMHANQIIVLANGRIVERGTHAELAAANGTYAALFRLQERQSAGLVAPHPAEGLEMAS